MASLGPTTISSDSVEIIVLGTAPDSTTADISLTVPAADTTPIHIHNPHGPTIRLLPTNTAIPPQEPSPHPLEPFSTITLPFSIHMPFALSHHHVTYTHRVTQTEVRTSLTVATSVTTATSLAVLTSLTLATSVTWVTRYTIAPAPTNAIIPLAPVAPASQSHRLGKPAIAGIVIGTFVGAMILLGLVTWALWARWNVRFAWLRNPRVNGRPPNTGNFRVDEDAYVIRDDLVNLPSYPGHAGDSQAMEDGLGLGDGLGLPPVEDRKVAPSYA